MVHNRLVCVGSILVCTFNSMSITSMPTLRWWLSSVLSSNVTTVTTCPNYVPVNSNLILTPAVADAHSFGYDRDVHEMRTFSSLAMA